MNKQRPILSICLPTNGAVQWVLPTLEGVYNQGVDLSLFEVVITDNGENSKLGETLKDFNYPNLKYIQTKDKGFLNLVTCLQKGTGLFNKMLNHRMVLKPGMLQKMINIVDQYKDTKPVLYFVNGNLKTLDIVECKDLNKFIYNMHYWVSWSAGIGFWDVDQTKLSEIQPNEMFPNASLLFEHRQDTQYVIWNDVYGKMQDESGKGGYDLFYTFAVVLNDLLSNLKDRNRISENTFKFVKRMLFKFLCSLYYEEIVNAKNTEHSFIIKNVKQSLSRYYSSFDYFILIIRTHIWLPIIKTKIVRCLKDYYKQSL